MIVIGYQGIGKSTLSLCQNGTEIPFIDLESGCFWNDGTRAEDWYKSYVKIALDLARQGHNVFVSSHKQVREELLKSVREDIYVWHELCFLNHNIPLGSPNKTQFTEAQFYAMRIQQIKWLAPAILAAEFIALHDKYHFSRPMLADLMAEIDTTRKEYKQNEKRLSRALYELTGIKIKGGRYDSHRVSKSGSTS